METAYCTIREFNTAQFRVVVDAVPDYTGDCGLPDDDGETLAKIESGEYLVFTARARVLHKTLGEIASDYLGACIYSDPADFQDHRECAKYTRELQATHGPNHVCGSYFASMVSTVCREARERLREMRLPYVRAE